MMPRLIGQSRAESILARSIAHDRVGHAYLFLGPRGCGKATAARLFAQALDCARQPAARMEQDGWRLAPCQECESCRRIAAGKHPEVIEVREGSKTGQNIGIDQARDIRRNAALRPKLGDRRIYLVPNAEAFSEPTSNALLKTLEEPSESVTLILCAPNPSQVLPTVRSRCQIIPFGLAPVAAIEVALTTSGTTPEIAAALARASGGRPGVAFSWAREPGVLTQRRGVLDVFARAVSVQGEAQRDPALGVLALRLGEELRGLTREEPEVEDAPPRPQKALHIGNLDTGLTLLRDLLLITQGADAKLVQNQDRVPQLLELARETHAGRVIEDIGAVREAQQLLDRNVAVAIALERMFWALIAGIVPVSSEALFSE